MGSKCRLESGHAANLSACTTGAAAGVSTDIINDVPDAWLPIQANAVTDPAGTTAPTAANPAGGSSTPCTPPVRVL